VAILGYRQIDLSATVLACLLLAEIGLLLVFDGAVLAREGFGALPAASFTPHVVFAGAPGIALGVVFQSFIGFEAAALYGEEARDPRRSVPLAIYSSVLLIGIFYCLTAWITVGAVGAGRARAVAGEQLGGFTLALNTEYAGELATSAMSLVVLTSIFATYLALHNAASRYLFALGRETVLPAPLGVAHPRRGSPHVASLTLTCATAIVAVAFAVVGLDPYIGFATTIAGMGTVGIMLLMALAALAIIVYFRRGHGGESVFKTFVAPLIGFLGLAGATVLLVANYSVITGTDSPFVNALPLLYVPAVVGGLIYAFWLRRSRPERYARVAVASAREEDG
jgi:amino acid transporter